jgi:hypothetical protein
MRFGGAGSTHATTQNLSLCSKSHTPPACPYLLTSKIYKSCCSFLSKYPTSFTYLYRPYNYVVATDATHLEGLDAVFVQLTMKDKRRMLHPLISTAGRFMWWACAHMDRDEDQSGGTRTGSAGKETEMHLINYA